MCGIAGLFDARGLAPSAERDVLRMLASIRHRGPDQFGLLSHDCAILGSARLSIVDLQGGQQPIANEDETLWIVFNGEVFNHVELRKELEQRGHRFTSRTDTETILHLYEELGPECLSRLNGQFAIAILDATQRSLFLARDRLGVRPLFYAHDRGRLIFGSEIKAILNGSSAPAELDHRTLIEVFTHWAPLPSHTAFRGIAELPPGHFLVARATGIEVRQYWRPDLSTASARTEEEDTEALNDLLLDATRLRLRADVPVGAYLSGGIDSSMIAALAREVAPGRLRTFSIAFTDVNFDERGPQQQMAEFLGTQHEVIEATHADIGRVFPDVIWHAEVPLMRTAPAPMFLLSKLVRDSGFKVVLTGEGADEFLAGYDIFKEAKVRRFWAREPGSRWRPLLLQRLYPDIFGPTSSNPAFLTAFFRAGLTDVDAPDYSHAIRWRNNRRACRFFHDAVLQGSEPSADPVDSLLPPNFASWGPLERAQFLEITTFLSPYLLSSQGDRMGMAHSVEGRFPFLDHRLVEFCCRLPARRKLRVLEEKYLLRRLSRRWLPEQVSRRRKRPYRAPIHRCFFNSTPPDYVRELLAPSALAKSGLFKPESIRQLVARLEAGKPLGETDDMALAGVLSTQLLHQQFIEDFQSSPPIDASQPVKVCRIGPAVHHL
jgi:asparagine synthase (glutamine-hydrolysing)